MNREEWGRNQRAREDVWLREERRRRQLQRYQGDRNAGYCGCLVFLILVAFLVFMVIITS